MREERVRTVEIQVRVNGRLEDIDLSTELYFDANDTVAICEAMANQPGKFAYYAALAIDATEIVDAAKAKLKKLCVEVGDECRKQYRILNGKDAKMTQKALETEVSMDRRVRGSEADIRRLTKDKRLLDVAVKAFEQRKSVLQSIGAMRRSEYDQAGGVHTPERRPSPYRREEEEDQEAEREAAIRRNMAKSQGFDDQSGYSSDEGVLGGKRKK